MSLSDFPDQPHCLQKLAFSLICMSLATSIQAETLRSQVEKLAGENGIQIEGLDRIGAEPSRSVGGDATQQIKSLLSDYNFMIVGQGGTIERLTITSLKHLVPKPRMSGAIKTQRLGTHHQVPATLSGPNGEDVPTTLLVDTGATTLVLPESMIATLGFVRENLQDGTTKTAGGSVPIKIGVLKSVKVGDVAVENVPVSFIADNRLEGNRLLGMSFLNRFRFSLDDENSELQLMAK